MRKFFDYYAILNVPTNASLETIRVAYEVRMIELCTGDFSPVEQERRVALLKLAAHVLGDEERRLATGSAVTGTSRISPKSRRTRPLSTNRENPRPSVRREGEPARPGRPGWRSAFCAF